MLMSEYNYEQDIEVQREEAFEEGKKIGQEEGEKRGKKIGQEEGEKKFAALTMKLIADGRMDDVKRAAQDIELRKKLYQEYEID